MVTSDMYTLEEIKKAVAAIYNDCGPSVETDESIKATLADAAEILLNMFATTVETIDKDILPEETVKLFDYYLAILEEE